MFSKNPTAVLHTRNTVLSASRSSRQLRLRDANPRGHLRPCRLFATVHDVKSGQKSTAQAREDPAWPTSAKPTPYDIFGLAKNTPYSKARYFQLAKLYHPDRKMAHATDDGIPHLTKLERYRLVVAANEILSNPQKKRMYDLYGFGWENQTDPQTRHREADRAWRQEPGNASMNATWEDWERWYQKQNGKEDGDKQEQIFTSNITFMAIVSLFLIVGTWSGMTRAGTNSASMLEQRDERHAAISKELRERQAQRFGLDRGDRVQSFIHKREIEKWAHDATSHGVQALPPPRANSAPSTSPRADG